jgi:hypothetical protein
MKGNRPENPVGFVTTTTLYDPDALPDGPGIIFEAFQGHITRYGELEYLFSCLMQGDMPLLNDVPAADLPV